MNKRNFFPFSLIVLVIFLAPTKINAQANDHVPSFFEHVYTEEQDFVSITLETDVRLLLRKKHKEEYQPATFTYTVREETPVTKTVKIKARGNIRKKVCIYPPIKLKFKKAELRELGLSSSNKLKLVLQCDAAGSNRDYLLKEYLIYKFYNLISPYSYRVQLLDILLKDSGGKKKDLQMYGLVIEPIDELAARTNAQILDRSTCKPQFLQDEPYKRMAVFQYMIGNTDWAVGNLHNLEVIKVPAYPKLVPVPYDFDYAGLVNTSYAIPHESLPIEHVTQRHYKGRTIEEEEIRTIGALFLKKKEEILMLAEELPNLDERDRKWLMKYLDDFFEVLESPKRSKFAFSR